MTMGIGAHCNYYFLKMAATMAKGFCEIAYVPEKITSQISYLVQMASVPVLTDVELDIDGVDACELYPFPVPDLFLGAPLVISGKYSGKFPHTIQLAGRQASGQDLAMAVPVQPAGDVPGSRVFLKQQLELKTAKAWLQGNETKEGQARAA
jgi:hypothetical protein